MTENYKTIEQITEKDKKELRNFIIKYFMKDEPICKSLGLLEFPELDDNFINIIPDRCCFKAINGKGEMIGVVLSALKKRPQPGEPIKKVVDCTVDDRWKLMCMLVDKINENYNAFDEYPHCNVMVDSRALAVNPKYRGQGVGLKLIQRAIQHIRENNYPIMQRFVTSKFSGNIMDQAGMKEVYRIDFKDFRLNGKMIVNLPEPHTTCRVFIVEA